MSAKRKRKRNDAEVEVPITPMLDMAFQLLTFFILTYNPAPTENQFAMSLLPVALKSAAGGAGQTDQAVEELKNIPVTLLANNDGTLAGVNLGENPVSGDNVLVALEAQLKSDFLATPDSFDKATLTMAPNLLYSELIKVVDVFMKNNITKISFDVQK